MDVSDEAPEKSIKGWRLSCIVLHKPRNTGLQSGVERERGEEGLTLYCTF